ncbi:MAG: hypothetical protein GXY15_00030 [Candidatus Hydrogenedentes bacterium]|nr:hypothetical protein [Candidatus Hydrogenedentota bacterium]
MLLVSDMGREHHLGTRLGRGGEGAVFRISNRPGFVAKIYHKALGRDRIEKLQHMVVLNDNELAANSAWPCELLYRKQTEPPCGFVMQAVPCGHELHELYGPASRKRLLPNATWAYLVHVARNLACAFSVLHARNIVIGDVNQSNAFACLDGKVILVDCDSYQVTSSTRCYPCHVGVPMYTPPELQGMSFRNRCRSPEHDGFGLAVLIFQLLFMGRHPFAGIGKMAQHLSLENGEAIRRGLYVYGQLAHQSGMRVPPNTLPINSVPPRVQSLLEAAFVNKGGLFRRPQATDWATALDQLKKGLVICRRNSCHVYSNHLKSCPWCMLAQNMGTVFFGRASFHETSGFSINSSLNYRAKVDAHVLQLSAYHDLNVYVMRYHYEGTPLPAACRGVANDFIAGVVIASCSILAAYAFSGFFLFGVLFGLGGIMQGWRKPEYYNQHIERKARLNVSEKRARSEYQSMRGLHESLMSKHAKMKTSALRTVLEYEQLESVYDSEMRSLVQKKRTLQLEEFLKRYMICSSCISGIGPARKNSLLAYGIETASDIVASKVLLVPGIKEHYYQVLSQWRRECEKKFIYDPSLPVPAEEIDRFNRRMLARRDNLQERIRKVLHELDSFEASASKDMSESIRAVEVACQEWKKAVADYRVMENT